MLIGLNVSYSFPRKELQIPLSDIEEMIVSASNGDVSAAEELAHISGDAEAQKINDDTLRNIVSLLDSPSGPVRLWAAAAVGNFGTRSAQFAPRLQKMVSEEACNMTGLSAADAASFALKKIGILPAPFGCKKSK